MKTYAFFKLGSIIAFSMAYLYGNEFSNDIIWKQ